uniref:Alkali-sensitive linkage protein 1 n=1 Tax=Talaromyces marneffei PM1 TaxID=1077442 RepID=A0A093VI55_TALMA
MYVINAFLATMMATAAVAKPHNLHAEFHKRATSAATPSKLGSAYNDVSLVSLVSSASWAYNWNLESGGPVPSGVDYCPMLWGPKMYNGWNSAVTTALSSGSSCILGFNEPDMASQANMNPEQAAADYQTYITPLSGQATLVTPAVTNGGGDNLGLGWMKKWLAACNGACKPNVMAVHYYANADVSYFYDFINNATALAADNGMDSVWITEFQDTGSDADQVAFLREVIPWLDSNTAVGRYAYFYTAEGYLLTDKMLSTVGQTYVSTS